MIKVFSCAHVFLCFSRSIGLSDTVVTFCYILLFLLTAPLFMANKAYHNGLHRRHRGEATDGLPMIREEPKTNIGSSAGSDATSRSEMRTNRRRGQQSVTMTMTSVTHD